MEGSHGKILLFVHFGYPASSLGGRSGLASSLDDVITCETSFLFIHSLCTYIHSMLLSYLIQDKPKSAIVYASTTLRESVPCNEINENSS